MRSSRRCSSSRAPYIPARAVQADVQRILNVYRRQGLYGAQVDPKIINLDTNRIDVVFEISEGAATKVRAINFIGNSAFSDSQLRYIITTSQTNILSFPQGQQYLRSGPPQSRPRVAEAVLHEERLRRRPHRFGHRRPRSRRSRLLITFTIDEGERYRFGTVNVESALPSLNTGLLGPYILVRSGKWFNSEKVEKTTEALTLGVSLQGYAFGQVKTRVDRDQSNSHRQSRLCHRRRPAHLHRADQHRRQYPHRGSCHQASIPPCRGRRLQSLAGRACTQEAEGARLLQDGGGGS